jgi:hypothetical protein
MTEKSALEKSATVSARHACANKRPKLDPHDPIARDTRAYRVCFYAICVGLLCVGLMGGLALKREHKISPTGSVHAGCYKWSDGEVTCQRGWRKLTEDQLYGCTPANQDAATGECK